MFKNFRILINWDTTDPKRVENRETKKRKEQCEFSGLTQKNEWMNVDSVKNSESWIPEKK